MHLQRAKQCQTGGSACRIRIANIMVNLRRGTSPDQEILTKLGTGVSVQPTPVQCFQTEYTLGSEPTFKLVPHICLVRCARSSTSNALTTSPALTTPHATTQRRLSPMPNGSYSGTQLWPKAGSGGRRDYGTYSRRVVRLGLSWFKCLESPQSYS